MIHRFAILLMAPLFLACGPTLLLPGGALSGASAAIPSDWAWTSDVSTIQLETRPDDPYSVNIWAIGNSDKLYVHAGANRSAWVEHMELNPDVRVRIDDKLYPLRAARVESQSEFDAFSNLYETKYGSRPRNESVEEAYLFRLMPR